MSEIQPTPTPGPQPAPEDITPTPAEPAALSRLLEFNARLANLTPRVWVTPMLMAFNVVAFVVLVLVTGSIDTPSVQTLVQWGGNVASKTVAGEWWRLLTTTFLHLTVIHLLLNVWVLAVVGYLVERLVGNIGFLLLYVISALVGSLGTSIWSPQLVGVGASGPIFGVCGALLALVLRQHDSIPPEAYATHKGLLVFFFGSSLVLGFVMPNSDNAASVAGLLAGFLCGLVLSLPSVAGTQASRPVRNLVAAGLGLLLVGGGALVAAVRNADVAAVQQEMERFVTVEQTVPAQVADALRRLQQEQLTREEFAQVIEREVLPPWREQRQRIDALRPALPQPRIPIVQEYMRLREEGWELLAQGMRTNDRQKLRQGEEKHHEAQRVTERLKR